MLIQLSGFYEKVIRGYIETQKLVVFVENETERLQELEGNAMESAVNEAMKTVNLSYPVEPFLTK